MSRFQQCLSETLKWEGGYADHPKDPGGPTMKGVTQRVYDGFRTRKGLHPVHVRSIKNEEVEEIYREQYWRLVCGDQLPPGVDLVLFDFAVNAGPWRAVRTMQEVLKIRTDGTMGNATLGAILSRDPVEIIEKLSDARLAFVKRLSTFKTFGKNWTRRTAGIKSAALAMNGNKTPEPTEGAYTEKASPTKLGLLSTDTGKGSAITGVGAAGTALTDAANTMAPLGEFGTLFRVVFAILLVAGVAFSVWAVLQSIKREAVE